MHAASPLETLFDLGGLPIAGRELVALVLLASAGAAWFSIGDAPSRRRFGGAIAFLGVSFFAEVLVPLFSPQGMAGTALRALALLTFSFALVRVAAIMLDQAARERQADFSTIFRDLATLLAYGVVVLVVARMALNVDVTPLLATSALVTAVIGLALQETLGNVFSGLSLQLQKPFEPGDWVRFGDHLGRVQGIGWRSTRLVTRSLELLEVPNGVLAREVITNFRGSAVGDELFVGLSYDAPPNRVKEIVSRLLHHSTLIAKSPLPQVWVVDYGDFAVKYRIRFWMVDFARQDDVRDEIMTSLWYALRRNGIEIPFPIRTLQIQRTDRRPAAFEGRHRELIATLREVDFLTELSEEELATLVPNLYEVQFGSGETICREGEPGDTFYVVRRGMVAIFAHGANADETHVADLSAPAFFGEMSLLTGEPRTATVRAKSDASLLVVEREGFESLFQSRPSVAEGVCRVLAARQTELRERREQASAGESEERRSLRLLATMRSIFGF
jgi:small-conductance mechanosensitive channel/CRP-like cAMP-binding protein